MMRKILPILFILFLFGCDQKPTKSNQNNIITTDIDNFWKAYDEITLTKDTLLQAQFLKELFLDKGTIGLEKMIQARRYTSEEYLYAINNYPKFWQSIRKDTYKAQGLSEVLENGIMKLGSLYPDLKPAKIYFTVGALRSNGTTMDSLVLIGTELAFANKDTPTDEFLENLSHLKSYFESEPSKNIVFLNIHEYVHTQQTTTIGENLLAQTVLEGVAEFIAEKALAVSSPNPQIQFGRDNDTRIKAKFEKEMFSPNVYNWIWNSPENEFGIRDLAYYVGYKICEQNYSKASNKDEAIKEMIELDYNNEKDLIAFVEKSGYFDQSLNSYKESFEKLRPFVTGLDDLQNNSVDVDIKMNKLTIHFSTEMNTRFRNFQLGDLGEENVVRFKDFLGFSKDGQSITFSIEPLEYNKKYQIVVGSGFRSKDGIPLIPYLIEFETVNN